MRRSTNASTIWGFQLGFNFGELETEALDVFVLGRGVAAEYGDFRFSEVGEGLPVFGRKLFLAVEALAETEGPVFFGGLEQLKCKRGRPVEFVEFHTGFDVSVVDLLQTNVGFGM